MPERVKPARATRWLVASRLCANLLSGPSRRLTVAHRSLLAWQLADSDCGRVVATLAAPEAVRLPASLLVDSLPTEPVEIVTGDGVLRIGAAELRPTRWYTPDRPAVPELCPRMRSAAALEDLVVGWRRLLGSGPGLTPYGDDVIAGALVTLLAAGHPIGARWAAEVTAAPLEARTTAVSAALLRAAAGGWCIPELARLFTALAAGAPTVLEQRDLLAVGLSSGTGLLAGMASVLEHRVPLCNSRSAGRFDSPMTGQTGAARPSRI